MNEPIAQAIVDLVAHLAGRNTAVKHRSRGRSSRPTRAAQARLALDAAAILAGLRPAVLLDYGGPAFRDEAGLAEFASGLSELSGTCTVRLVRLRSQDGGHSDLDAGPALFLARLPLVGQPVPWPVELSGAGSAGWGEPDGLEPGLSAVAAALDRAAGASGPLDVPCSPTPPSAVAAWLLGYPVALVVGEGGAALGAAPSATLVALRAAPPPALLASLDAQGWPLPPGVLGEAACRVDVSSFAVLGGRPGEEGEDDAWLGAWTARVRQSVEGTGWSDVGVLRGGMGGGGLAV